MKRVAGNSYAHNINQNFNLLPILPTSRRHFRCSLKFHNFCNQSTLCKKAGSARDTWEKQLCNSKPKHGGSLCDQLLWFILAKRQNVDFLVLPHWPSVWKQKPHPSFHTVNGYTQCYISTLLVALDSIGHMTEFAMEFCPQGQLVLVRGCSQVWGELECFDRLIFFSFFQQTSCPRCLNPTTHLWLEDELKSNVRSG